ncbi:hypothetical protein QQX98_004170 [Neonectria punicea]|uniref:Uncharacterized protein n=1 Tax=Neonectria punicea TaxID=979145 RepID=A0ABR1HAE9_9HYPO
MLSYDRQIHSSRSRACSSVNRWRKIFQPVWKPDVKIGLTYVERDLGLTVLAILENYETKPELLKEPVYAVPSMWSPGDLAWEIEKQSGEKVRIVNPPSWGNKWLDITYTHYNEWGVFLTLSSPTPRTLLWGSSCTT